MKIRITKRCELEGKVFQKYATAVLNDTLAQTLIKDGLAIEATKKIKFVIQMNSNAAKKYREEMTHLAAMIINDHWSEYFDRTNVILRLSDRVLSAQLAMTKDLFPWVLEYQERDKSKLTKAGKLAKELWEAVLNELSAKLVDSYIPAGIIRDEKGKKVDERFLFD